MTAEAGSIAVTVRLYSVLRHRNERIVDALTLLLPPGSTVQDVLDLLEVDPRLEPLLVVGGELAPATAVLGPGDQIALIPAVAGGGA